MKYFLIFLLSLTFLSCEEEQPAASEGSLPNIVLIIGDDHGYPYFGFMGADYVQTPNMDTLANSGTLFTNAYVPANHCRPSLQALMTGTLPIQYDNKVEQLMQTELDQNSYLPDDVRAKQEREFKHHAMKYFSTLPKLLATRGYKSFQGGKWWEFNYQNGGFTDGMTTGWTEEDRQVGGKWFKKFMGGDGLELGRVTNEAVENFIDQSGEKPFFIWFAPELPHYPFDAPEKYYSLYADKEMTESAKRYYANCTWFDDSVGDMIDYLKKKSEFDNTLFIYVNDNGWEQNPDQEFRHDSLRWHNGGDKGKSSMFDQSFRTPIIFSWKNNIEAQSRKTDLMHSADIPATILDYVGIDIPEDYFGQSYKSIIEGKEMLLRDKIIGRITTIRSEENMMGKPQEGYWLRNRDWFFKWNVSQNEQTLFDMKKDPFNNHNVLEKHPELEAKFKKEIEEWKAKNSIE